LVGERRSRPIPHDAIPADAASIGKSHPGPRKKILIHIVQLDLMGYEVEIKFRAADHADLKRRLLALGIEEGPVSEQEDIYG